MSNMIYEIEVRNESEKKAIFYIASDSTLFLLQSHYSSSIGTVMGTHADNFDMSGIQISDVRRIMDYIYSK